MITILVFWAVLEQDGSLSGHIYFHLGDDSGFVLSGQTAGDDGSVPSVIRTCTLMIRSHLGMLM